MYFDNDVSKDVRELYAYLCPVAKIVSMDLKKYPKYVQDLQQYRFKPIMEALSLQNHKLVLNIDTSVRFNESADFTVSYFSNIDFDSESNAPIKRYLSNPPGNDSRCHPT